MKLPLIIMTLFFCSCTLSDSADYTLITKATVNLKYRFTKDGSNLPQEIENVSLFIFDGNGNFFRRTDLSREDLQLTDGVVETYLPNDTYTLVSFANAKDNTVFPQFTTNTTLSGAQVRVQTTTGAVATADNLMYERLSLPIKKGEHPTFDVELSKVTYKVKVNITGVEYLEGAALCTFKLQHSSAISFDGKVTPTNDTYIPQTTLTDGATTGDFNILQFGAQDNITIGMYSATNKTIFESSIGSYLSESIKGDLESGKTVTIQLNIEINSAEIKIYIADWLIATVQRSELGS